MSDARHLQIGKRFRRVATQINWEYIKTTWAPLLEANESLLHPAKLAGHEGVITTDEKIATVLQAAKIGGGRIVRAARDLERELTIDFARESLRARLERQKTTPLSTDEIEQMIEPQIADADLGERLLSAMDNFLDRLREPVEPLYDPIRRFAIRFKDALFSELKRLEVVGVCEECGQTFVMMNKRKRFCSVNFENRDCGARARNRQSYKKRTMPTKMTRSESGRNAANSRWKKLESE